jgi:hypothetical protein
MLNKGIHRTRPCPTHPSPSNQNSHRKLVVKSPSIYEGTLKDSNSIKRSKETPRSGIQQGNNELTILRIFRMEKLASQHEQTRHHLCHIWWATVFFFFFFFIGRLENLRPHKLRTLILSLYCNGGILNRWKLDQT